MGTSPVHGKGELHVLRAGHAADDRSAIGSGYASHARRLPQPKDRSVVDSVIAATPRAGNLRGGLYRSVPANSKQVEPRGIEPRFAECDSAVIPLDHGPGLHADSAGGHSMTLGATV